MECEDFDGKGEQRYGHILDSYFCCSRKQGDGGVRFYFIPGESIFTIGLFYIAIPLPL